MISSVFRDNKVLVCLFGKESEKILHLIEQTREFVLIHLHVELNLQHDPLVMNTPHSAFTYIFLFDKHPNATVQLFVFEGRFITITYISDAFTPFPPFVVQDGIDVFNWLYSTFIYMCSDT